MNVVAGRLPPASQASMLECGHGPCVCPSASTKYHAAGGGSYLRHAHEAAAGARCTQDRSGGGGEGRGERERSAPASAARQHRRVGGPRSTRS
jgi:hypothetical protein